MLLVVAATQKEMAPFVKSAGELGRAVRTSVCGVGPVEAAVTLTRLLERCGRDLDGVVAFGIGGAYRPGPEGVAATMLELCLATKEVLGDYGVCYGERLEAFPGSVPAAPTVFLQDHRMLGEAEAALAAGGLGFRTGTFVTVNAASGTASRGALLSRRYNGLCENMEGAAIARACSEFGLPMLEMRVISNLVEDRPGSPWNIDEACELAAKAALVVIRGLLEQR